MAKQEKSTPVVMDALDAAKVMDSTKSTTVNTLAKPAASDAEVVVPKMEEKPVQPESKVVARRVTISWGSQMITLNPGDVVSESSYGPGSLQRMQDSGVAFE